MHTEKKKQNSVFLITDCNPLGGYKINLMSVKWYFQKNGKEWSEIKYSRIDNISVCYTQ